jgi:hypothetical protein
VPFADKNGVVKECSLFATNDTIKQYMKIQNPKRQLEKMAQPKMVVCDGGCLRVW